MCKLKRNKTGGNKFNSGDNNKYFIAANVERLIHTNGYHDNLLVAINELNTQKDLDEMQRWMVAGANVFIDSGIFNLTNEHMKKHNITMDEALALAPEDIDGFEQLFDKYISIIRQYGDNSWGYIELDQGGRENKIKTRAKLEKMGLFPIPVYHPLNDGWDYFDYLAERYDRICFGNVVQADKETRRKLVTTAYFRKQKYPNLWIHLLGLTPNSWLYSLPINSTDSSSWLSSVKWSGQVCFAAGNAFSKLPKNYKYVLGSDNKSSVGSRKATAMSAYGCNMMQLNWQNHVERINKL